MGPRGYGESAKTFEAAGVADGTGEGIDAGERLEQGGPVLCLRGAGVGRFGEVQELSAQREAFVPMAVGKEPVVADAHKTLGEDVQKKAADELVGIEGQVLCDAAVFVVLPGEGDSVVVHTDKTVVRDGNAVCIASEVVEDLLGSGEGRLGIDDPFHRAVVFDEFVEGGGLGQVLEAAMEVECGVFKGLRDEVKEETAEEA
jgi:hypothetical protein